MVFICRFHIPCLVFWFLPLKCTQRTQAFIFQCHWFGCSEATDRINFIWLPLPLPPILSHLRAIYQRINWFWAKKKRKKNFVRIFFFLFFFGLKRVDPEYFPILKCPTFVRTCPIATSICKWVIKRIERSKRLL